MNEPQQLPIVSMPRPVGWSLIERTITIASCPTCGHQVKTHTDRVIEEAETTT